MLDVDVRNYLILDAAAARFRQTKTNAKILLRVTWRFLERIPLWFEVVMLNRVKNLWRWERCFALLSVTALK